MNLKIRYNFEADPIGAFGLRELLARVPFATEVRIQFVQSDSTELTIHCPEGKLWFDTVPDQSPERWHEWIKVIVATVADGAPLHRAMPPLPRDEDGIHQPVHLHFIVAGLLLGWDEQRVANRDEHKRWYARATSYPTIFDRPIVDEIAMEFARELSLLSVPLDHVKGPTPSMAMTFDIDSDGMFGGKRTISNLRRAFHEGGMDLARRFVATRNDVRAGRATDPHTRFEELHARLPGPATFFVQVAKAHPIDNYDLVPDSPMAKKCKWLRDQGHEIGLHGSYETVDRPQSFLEMQCERFEKALGFAPTVYRAHFLRHYGEESERLFASCGLRIDSSLGTPDLHGYRRGTAHAVFPRSGGANLINVPMHSMDVTLRRQYGFEEMERALDGMALLIDRSKSVGGCHVFLSHPHNMEPLFWKGWEDLPIRVAELAQHRAMRFVTIGQHVEEETERRRLLFTNQIG